MPRKNVFGNESVQTLKYFFFGSVIHHGNVTAKRKVRQLMGSPKSILML